MKTKSGIFLMTLLMTGASAQTSGNIVFSTEATGATLMASPGMATMAFVAGELSGSTVKGAPYSAQPETQTTQVLADGNRIVNTTTASVYRDASGRERREQSMPSLGSARLQNASVQTVMISDPVAGVNYSLNSVDHVAMKMPMPSAMAGVTGKAIRVQKQAIAGSATTMAMPMPSMPVIGSGPMVFSRATSTNMAGDPPKVEQLGTRFIEGVQAQGTRTTFTIPAGQIGNDQPLQIVDESWRSQELQVIVQSMHSDPRMGTTTYALRNISRNDPSPSLFQVPADYTVQEAPAMGPAMAPVTMHSIVTSPASPRLAQ